MSDGAGRRGVAGMIAGAVTEVCSPAVVVVLLSLAVAWPATGYRIGPSLFWGMVVAVFSSLLPMAFIVRGARLGRWDGHHVRNREGRRVPLLLALGSTVIGLVVLLLGGPRDLIALDVAMLTTLLACTLITQWWKVSLHSAVAGGATATMVLLFGTPQRKATFLGAINGMITGLVAITPAAGFVNGLGAMIIGVVASSLVWLSWNKLSKVGIFKRVDDTLGVVHTHGVAGLAGGLLVGLLADPNMVEYLGTGHNANVSFAGLFYGHPKQLAVQAGAAATIIVWDALVTFLLLKFLGLFMPLRMSDQELEIGDVAAHDEEAYPDETMVSSPSQPAGVGAGKEKSAVPTALSEVEPSTG